LAHENLDRKDELKLGSNRSFGFVFAAVFSIVAAVRLWHGSGAYLPWFIAAAVFAAVALFAPAVLRPLNFLWFKLGLLLHHIVTPVILGLMFYTVFTPIGFWMRMMGKRPLNLRFDRDAKTYWIVRQPPGPPPESFNNQF
jgi:hypothetical protein